MFINPLTNGPGPWAFKKPINLKGQRHKSSKLNSHQLRLSIRNILDFQINFAKTFELKIAGLLFYNQIQNIFMLLVLVGNQAWISKARNFARNYTFKLTLLSDNSVSIKFAENSYSQSVKLSQAYCMYVWSLRCFAIF